MAYHGPQSGSSAMLQALDLTPQEMNLYQHHLDELSRGGVKNEDGTISTVLQRVVEGPDGKFYNVPSVWNGKILHSEDAAREQAAKAGWAHWPSYDTPEEADQRYMQMHGVIERDTDALSP